MKTYKAIEVNLYNELMSIYEQRYSSEPQPQSQSIESTNSSVTTRGTQTEQEGGKEAVAVAPESKQSVVECSKTEVYNYWTAFEDTVKKIQENKKRKRRR